MGVLLRSWLPMLLIVLVLAKGTVQEVVIYGGSGADYYFDDDMDDGSQDMNTTQYTHPYIHTGVLGRSFNTEGLEEECEEDTCGGHGRCYKKRLANSSVPVLMCECDTDYTGRWCDRPAINYRGNAGGPCADPSKCNGGQCEPLIGGRFRCRCPPGFSGPTCGIVSDPCSTVVCTGGTSCQDVGGVGMCSPTTVDQPTRACTPVTCMNGGMCSEMPGRTFSCTCRPGFTGLRCQNGAGTRAGPCATNPCGVNGRCSVVGLNFRCVCNAGFSGARCQSRSGRIGTVNPCATNPCYNGGRCRAMGMNFQCTCVGQWTGVRCQTSVPNPCGVRPCMNGGTCTVAVPGTNSFRCTCAPGFSGGRCENGRGVRISPCQSNPCLNFGACSNMGSTFRCTCRGGFTGTRCEIPQPVNPCTPNRCLNGGTCFPGGRSFRCTCFGSWTGTRCEIPLTRSRPCDSRPCLNGGLCAELGNSFRCTCVGRWTGTRCETPLPPPPGPCTLRPCLNGGRCQELGSTFKCTCVGRWTGTRCETPLPPPPGPCTSRPCLNGARCQELGSTFKCTCVGRWTGTRCEIPLPPPPGPCSSRPCLNGGRCQEIGNTFQCTCVGRWTGIRCETPLPPPPGPCTLRPCLNGGRCQEIGSTFQCTCVGRWTGTRCQTPLPPPPRPCSSRPCFNGGRCQEIGTTFKCNCVGRWTGTTCRTLVPGPCSTIPCMNGGTCREIPGGFVCSCTPMWTGDTCDIDAHNTNNPCIPNPCQNGCNCLPSCKHEFGYYCKGDGFFGKKCNIPAPTVTCDPTMITIVVNARIVTDYAGSIGGFTVFMSDSATMIPAPACPAVLTGSTYVVTLPTPFASCGAIVNDVNGKTVVSSKIWMNKLIGTNADMPISLLDFTCEYQEQYDVVSSLRPVLGQAPTVSSVGPRSGSANIDLCKIGTSCPAACPAVYSLTQAAVYTVGQMIHIRITPLSQGTSLRLSDFFLSCSDDVVTAWPTAPVVLVSGGCLAAGSGKYIPTTVRTQTEGTCVSFRVPMLPSCSQFFIHARMQPCTAFSCVAPFGTCSGRRKRSSDIQALNSSDVEVFGPIFLIDLKPGTVTKIDLPELQSNKTDRNVIVVEDTKDPDAEMPSNEALHIALGVVLVMAVIILSVLVGLNWHQINAHCGRKF